jgi:hypothetical protein
MAQSIKWTMDNYRAFSERRDRLTENYNNNLNIVKQRSVPAALDYPGAVDEVKNAKNQIQSTIQDIKTEGETLIGYLKQIQTEMGPEIVNKIYQDEKKLQKLIDQNNEMEKKALLRKEQAMDQNKKYESNFHSTIFSYMPWEIQYSKWYSFSPTNPYIDLSEGSRSTILFISCIFGISALIIIIAFVIDFLRINNIQISNLLMSKPTSVIQPGFLQQTVQRPQPIMPRVQALPLPVTKRVR